MLKGWRLLGVLVAGLFLASCADDATAPDDRNPLALAKKATCSNTDITDLADAALASGGQKNALNSHCVNIEEKVKADDSATALEMALDAVDQILELANDDQISAVPPDFPTVDDVVQALIEAFLDAAGAGGGDVTIRTITPADLPIAIVSNGTRSALVFDVGDISGPVITSQIRLPDQPMNGCPFSFDPSPVICFNEQWDWSVEPQSNLTGFVDAWLCVDDSELSAAGTPASRVQIASEEDGGLVFWGNTPESGAPSGFSDCSPPVDISLGPLDGLAGLFRATPAFASPGRLGSSVGAFTPFAPVDRGDTAPDPSTGSIAGTVTDDTEAVVPGATVIATNVDTEADFAAVTNASGQYVLNGLPFGTYDVEASIVGCTGATDTASIDAFDPDAVVDLVLDCSGGGTISGTVLQDTGDGCVGNDDTTVTIEDTSTDTGSPFTDTTGTDLDGNYEFTGVPLGAVYDVQETSGGVVEEVDLTSSTSATGVDVGDESCFIFVD